MKAQLNLRRGHSKEGFRILKRFPNMQDARNYLQEFIRFNTNYRNTETPDVFYDDITKTQLWLSKQFTPTRDYRYRNPNKQNNYGITS